MGWTHHLRSGMGATLAALSVWCSVPAFSEPLEDFTITSWSRRDGIALPVWSITQDRDGYLWLGTGSGLSRFDGHRFVTWEALGHERLPANPVLALLSARDGSLWIAAGEAGIGRLLNGRFSFYRDSHLAFTRTLFQDRQGVIWAGSRVGLYQFDGTQWVQQGPAVGLPVSPNNGIYEDARGALWIYTLQGRYRREPGASTFTRIVQAEWPPFGTIRDQRGDIWFPSIGRGIARMRDPGGARTTERITTANGLASNVVGAVFEDRESNIWIGTPAALHELSPRKVTPVGRLGSVTMVQTTKDGATWFGSSDGLIRITAMGRETFTERHGLPARVVRALTTDRAGLLWIATDSGLARFVNGRFVTVTPKAPQRFGRITALSVDSASTVWLTDFQYGVMRLKDGVLTPLDAIAALSSRAVRAFVDRSDRVWLGLGDGKLGQVLPNDTVTLHDVGLSGSIGVITEGVDGVLWIAGENGIARFTDGKAVAVTDAANGLPGSHVTSLVADASGAIWAGTNVGIVRLEQREFDAVASNPSHRVRTMLYDESDGLPGMPAGLASPSAARGADGRLWFITEGDATVVNPSSLPSVRPAPRVRVEEVRAGGQTFVPGAEFRVAPRPERVDIDYTALTFNSPGSVTFRYHLSGFDSSWQNAGTRRQATYTNLPPGRYTFRVTAHGKDGASDPAGAAVTFTIAPAFYQTAWFALAVFSTVVALAALTWRLRVRQIRKRFDLVLSERTRIGREVHDTLLQSLVGVALRTGTVARRLPPSTPRDARLELDSLRKEVEEQIREIRQTIWNLRSPTLEERGLVGAIQHTGERVAQQMAADFALSVDGKARSCPATVEQHLLRIAQEALLNAGRHSHASSIRTEIDYGENVVTLRVIDNGIGFDSNVRDVGDGHFGLTHMRERAAQAGGRLDIVSEKGGGTRITAAFPLARRGAA